MASFIVRKGEEGSSFGAITQKHQKHQSKTSADFLILPHHVTEGEDVSSATKADVPSLSLGNLPAELRNAIYELSFTTEECTFFDITNTSPPSSALTKVSREVRRETKGLYETARARFFDVSELQLNILALDSGTTIRALPTGLLQSMKHFKMNIYTKDMKPCVRLDRNLQASYPIWTCMEIHHPNLELLLKYTVRYKDGEGVPWVVVDIPRTENGSEEEFGPLSWIHEVPTALKPLGDAMVKRALVNRGEPTESDMTMREQLLFLFGLARKKLLM